MSILLQFQTNLHYQVDPGQDAVSGIYYISVEQVATVQQIVSNDKVSLSDVVLSAGSSFSIELYGSTESISFTADSDMTIDDLINKINEEASKKKYSCFGVESSGGKWNL